MATSNGIIELVDEKSSDSGFYCQQLVIFIMQESQESGFPTDDLWFQRFGQAKNGTCIYRNSCPIYARTMSNPKNKQLQFEF